MGARGGHEAAYLFRRRVGDDGDGRGLLFRSKFFEHGGEFKLVKQGAARAHIGRLRAHVLKLQLDRHFAMDGHQLFAQQDGIPVVLERLAIPFSLYLRGTIEGRLDAAKLLDQFDRTLISDSRSARDVVYGIAAQSHHVDDLLRRDPEHLNHFFAIEDQVVFYRVQHLHLAGYELQHVFIVRNHEYVVALIGSLPRQGADDIVGFKAFGLQDGNAKRLERPAD